MASIPDSRFRKCFMAMVDAARADDWPRVHDLYARFAPLIVFEQQPGVAVRKELLRRRGLLASARARHPGATITPPWPGSSTRSSQRTLPGVDFTQPIAVWTTYSEPADTPAFDEVAMSTVSRDPAQADDVAERTRRHITRRLAPFLFVLYVLNYMDRVNISFAALQMTGDLDFSNAVFGFGAGIFFIGYFLLQIPATMLIEPWSARKFIGVSLIVWGGLATLTGLITSAQQFYWIRFFLGAAEAGFFPGVIVYLTHWYRYEDRGQGGGDVHGRPFRCPTCSAPRSPRS